MLKGQYFRLLSLGKRKMKHAVWITWTELIRVLSSVDTK